MTETGNSVSDWSLFGWDLSQIGAKVALGVRQILWGTESGLQKRFLPKSCLYGELHCVDSDDAEAFGLVVASQSDAEHAAIVLPEALVLTKIIELPATAELEVEAFLSLEVDTISPFSADETCFGWRTVRQTDAALRIHLVLASRSSIDRVIAEADIPGHAGAAGTEVWAVADGKLVRFDGVGASQHRRSLYLSNLTRMGLRSAFLAAGLTMLAASPAAMLSIRENQFAEILSATEIMAGTATAARNELLEAEDSLAAAAAFFEERRFYGSWLNRIAELTPDSAYLTRMSFNKSVLTITGQAENAAQLQTTFAGAASLSEVAAPSAFTRDPRTGKERFTLTMRLSGWDQ